MTSRILAILFLTIGLTFGFIGMSYAGHDNGYGNGGNNNGKGNGATLRPLSSIPLPSAAVSLFSVAV